MAGNEPVAFEDLDLVRHIVHLDHPAAGVRRALRWRRATAAAVELEIDGVAVRIARGADAGVISAVIEALKAPR